MSPDELSNMYWNHPLEDNQPGKFRPTEDLIEVVSGKLTPGGRALDLSNDDGINSLYLAQSGYSVALMGIFTGEVELARKRVEEAKARVAVFVSEPTSLPFHQGEFDFAFDPRLAEDLKGEERGAFIREVHRVLRPGGLFLVLIHNYKDSPVGCFTRDTVEDMFHPLFERVRVQDSNVVEEDGALRMYYQILLRKP